MIEYLVAPSIWWPGHARPAALRINDDGTVEPVGAEVLAGLAGGPAGGGAAAQSRRFPGTLLPGLVDAHVHSALVDLPTVRAGGIAAVWELGSEPAAIAALADRAARAEPARLADRAELANPAGRADRAERASGLGALPRIRYAGPFLIAPGGYPSDRAWAPAGSWWEIDSAAAAVDAVGHAHAGGATLIKVTAHTGGPLLPAQTMAALVEAAHAAGLPVVVHAEGPGTVAAAYEAGADLLAHTPWTEALDDALIRDCAGRMQWISTLDIHTGSPFLVTAVDNLRRFFSYGGSVRYGTDLGNGPLPPAVNPGEIRHLQSAGLSPADILTAMTEFAMTGFTETGFAKTGFTETGFTGQIGAGARDVGWVAGGLDLDPGAFAGSLATARVLGRDVRPRTGAEQVT